MKSRRMQVVFSVNLALLFLNLFLLMGRQEPSTWQVPGTLKRLHSVEEYHVETAAGAATELNDAATIEVGGESGSKANTSREPFFKRKDFRGESFVIHERKLPKAASSTVQSQIWRELRATYRPATIKNQWNINCQKLLNGDEVELRRAENLQRNTPKVPIYEETYLAWTKNCEDFRQQRGYIRVPLSEEEEHFPLAFSIAVFKDVEQVERILRAVYHPQNLYCLHVDIKSPLLFHRAVQAIADCFPNVFVSSRVDKIKWGDVSVLLPTVNCMSDLVKFYPGRFHYFLDLNGQEFPLRTNLEFVKIAKIFNGSNDIGGSRHRMDMDRVRYIWTHRWSKTYQQTIFYNSLKEKAPNPHNYTFFKGELHGFFSRRMVEYIVESPTAREFLQWCWDTGHPSEHYWNTLNYNVQLEAPGSYNGPLEEAHRYSYNLINRAKHWISTNYGDRQCSGQVTRGICVFGVRDIPWLHTRPEMVANKFYLTSHYVGYDCLEERQRNRTIAPSTSRFNDSLYWQLPTVKYSRKDGLS